MLPIILASIAVIVLIIASLTDIKTREVPDWINFSIIPLGLGIRLIWSLSTNDYSYIIEGLVGFSAFFILALLMFYTGQWGGGDSKMLMGLGALIGLPYQFLSSNINWLIEPLPSFLINTIVVGSIYGFVWSIILSLKNRKKFLKEIKKTTQSIAKLSKIMMVLFVILLFSTLLIQDIVIKILVILLIVFIHGSFYLFIFIKAVEKSCMLKYVKPTEVTEGDWIAKKIFVNKKYIAGPKDLGIEKKQLNQLINYYKKGKIKKVLIKVGIPFVPSFLIAYLFTLWIGNILLLFI
ncbi:hypothetical protein CEE44_03985 [Candidatus Woesearchaeota archaeon B3_Woes]|nr:MAG: hypothetical protein CEE44_03985 [Candidatus Woesearchaeota archaeon B3_Woes]